MLRSHSISLRLCWIAALMLGVLMTAATRAADENVVHSFERVQLSDQFFCEGATCADVNRDGATDIIAGPYWYAGPGFTERFEIYEPKPLHIDGYSNNFFAFAYDINQDDWQDVLVVGFPGKEAAWFENPRGGGRHWPRHLAFDGVDNESPTFADLTGDGRPELVFHTAGRLGYAEIPDPDQAQPWIFHAIAPDRGYGQFNHGLGVGDVNGDGRMDLLEKNGWWEQPRFDSADELWSFHPVTFATAGGAQMFAYDVDGDGDNDVVTSKDAHGYGLAWFENIGPATGDVGSIRFREHRIMGNRPEQNEYGVSFSQLHALAMADVDGDGIKDIVTGKRFWAHGDKDPGSLDPAVVYWFKTVRDNGRVRFVPYQADFNSGVGTQVVVGDVNNDDWPDIVVGNKKGTFVFLHDAQAVDRTTWDRAQPVSISVSLRGRAGEGGAPAEPTADGGPPSNKSVAGSADEPPNGFPATAADGRVLNLDFETGDLSDWTATGTAFDGQPIEGDTVIARRGDMRSGHAGQWWIGTFEVGQDGPKGTLTSAPFPVTHRYASFLVGGGSHELTKVEIVRHDTGEVVFSASGLDNEQLHRVAVDLQPQLGQQIVVRLIDEVSYGWGHINFDDFRFHDREPGVPVVNPVKLTPDEYPYGGLTAEEAARLMRLPNGFSVTVFAAEPDVKQPIAMALDDRGRVWIAEAYEYPRRAQGQGRDRILVFEDTNGDGRFDTRKVFAEHLNLVSGLEVGFGGVWVGAAPYLLFIPDRDGDDVPDSEPEILLDGWGYQDTHETLNSFIWGPDGWLYGCHGVFTHSRVGPPGTPVEDRVPINAGIWRYHPTRHEFEVFAHGTSNPWGVDFDDHGQAIATACVIPHLWHMVQGGRYHRQAGQHFNPYTSADIKTIADHLHYQGDSPWAGNDRSDRVGGGHAHAGAMIYLGDAWPARYRGQVFMNNIHGQRVNVDVLERRGSGFVGRHGPDFLLTQDRASQMLNFRYGPDGQVYIIDWYDMQACHDPNVDMHDRSNGRIYKVCYGDTRPVTVNLKTLNDLQLAELCLEANDWYVRHARRILQERADVGTLDAPAVLRLVDVATTHPDATRRLRALWALHVTGQLTADLTDHLLGYHNEYVRAWAIQLSLDNDRIGTRGLLSRFAAMAETDDSPVVRLYLASAAGRLPIDDRWEILAGLAGHAEDVDDHNLPLMLWYAAEPLAEADPQRALAFGLSCGKTIPTIRDFMIRRIGSLDADSAHAMLVRALGKSRDVAEQLAMLRGIRSSLRGRRQVEPPREWSGIFRRLMDTSNEQVRREAAALGVTFGDQAAMDEFRTQLVSPKSDAAARREALESLLAAHDPQLAPTLRRLLDEPVLRDLALRGLAEYDDPETPREILAVYSTLLPAEKRAAMATLAARPAFALEMLRAVADGKIPTTDLSADLVRQLHNLADDDIDALINDVWGQVRFTPADKQELIAKYQKLLTESTDSAADPRLGRAVFAKTCAQCHTLYGIGSDIGPDLTGSNRSDVDYLLSNVVDPSALIAKEYQSTIIITIDGRVVTGVVSEEDDRSVTIRNATETLVIPIDEIDERELSDVSLMPDDQLKQYSDREVVSLFTYLMGKSQTPMLATKDVAALLFNGRDLAGWRGDSQLWSVEDGEIVGRSPGIDHNSFLVTDLWAKDFRLTLEVKLVDNAGNSGVQFRSQPIRGFEELRGYQADIGPDWWGKLYEEHGRELLWDKSGEQHLRPGDWNKYEILAEGSHIRTWLNGQLCVDLDDPAGSKEGVFALQIHAGGPMEVRFRKLKLEVLANGPID